jgi:hypothetical protein
VDAKTAVCPVIFLITHNRLVYKEKICGYSSLLWCVTHLFPKKLTDFFCFLPISILQEGYEVCAGLTFFISSNEGYRNTTVL